MITMCNAVTPPLTRVNEIPRLRDATIAELNNDDMINLGDVHCQMETNLSFFSEKDLINDDSSFCSHILLAIDDQYHVFLLLKVFYYLMSAFVCKLHF